MWQSCTYGLSAFVTLAMAGIAASGEPEIRLVGDPAQPEAVEVVGLGRPQIATIARTHGTAAEAPRLAEHLTVHVAGDGAAAAGPAVLGTYALTETGIRFTPRYALRPGMAYRATARLPSTAGGVLTKEFQLPEPPPGEPTKVVAIYPSAAILPENQLRFYIHFSAPMSEGEAYQHVKLMRDDGQEVTRAFLEIGEELWDGTGTRLTLLFDPGRVKQGLKPREEFGPVLEIGRGYRLVVDKYWHDARGQTLASGFEKAFKAGPMIETPVDAKKWQVGAPRQGTRDAITIQFPSPLDRALLNRMIGVVDAGGMGVEGEISVSDQEKRWDFQPMQAWKAGKYELVVDTALEDSAGNNLARPFEVDVFEEVDKSAAPEYVRVPFEVAPGAKE